MGDALRQLATPIIIEIMLPVLMGAVSAGLGWAIFWLRKWTGYQVDEQRRERITVAAERAVAFGLQKVLQAKGLKYPSLLSMADYDQVLSHGADYLQMFNPADVKAAGLDRDRLRDRLTPLLPMNDRTNLG